MDKHDEVSSHVSQFCKQLLFTVVYSGYLGIVSWNFCRGGQLYTAVHNCPCMGGRCSCDVGFYCIQWSTKV